MENFKYLTGVNSVSKVVILMLHPQKLYDSISSSLKEQYPKAEIKITDSYTPELFHRSQWEDNENEELVKPNKILILDDQVRL